MCPFRDHQSLTLPHCCLPGEGAAGFDMSLLRGRSITVGTRIPVLGGFFGWITCCEAGPLLFATVTTYEGVTLSPRPGDTKGENRCFHSSEVVEHLLVLFKSLRPGHVVTFCLHE